MASEKRYRNTLKDNEKDDIVLKTTLFSLIQETMQGQ